MPPTGGLGELVEPGLLDGAHRRPAHAEVALDGAGDRCRGHHLAGQLRLLGVELDHGVDVGGRAADVDDDDVTGARVLARRAPGPAARPR